MTYYINITLKTIHKEIDLGDAPIEWSEQGLDFLDAPYAFYEFIDEALGYDEATYTARTKFLNEFFNKLNDYIKTLGFSDNLEFNLNMSDKFFGLCFIISTYEV